MKAYDEIPLGKSDPLKSKRQKEIEHELICLIHSWRGKERNKERIKELKKELKLEAKKRKLNK